MKLTIIIDFAFRAHFTREARTQKKRMLRFHVIMGQPLGRDGASRNPTVSTQVLYQFYVARFLKII